MTPAYRLSWLGLVLLASALVVGRDLHRRGIRPAGTVLVSLLILGAPVVGGSAYVGVRAGLGVSPRGRRAVIAGAAVLATCAVLTFVAVVLLPA